MILEEPIGPGKQSYMGFFGGKTHLPSICLLTMTVYFSGAYLLDPDPPKVLPYHSVRLSLR